MKNRWATITTLGSIIMVAGVITACGSGDAGYATNPNSQSNTTSAYSAAPSSTGSQSGATPGLAADKTNKTATLTLVAAQTGDNNGFNFNGYSNGAMQVIIPLDWTVKVNFQNGSTDMMHSAMIVPYDQRSQPDNFTLAFPNASTPNPAQGTTSGVTQTFSFTANKEGTYAIVCAVPGHSSSGFWDTLMVSSKATAPIVQTTSTGSTSSSNSGW